MCIRDSALCRSTITWARKRRCSKEPADSAACERASKVQCASGARTERYSHRPADSAACGRKANQAGARDA
eukprot:15353875-Alexandrium_andersonii.AAC.1